MKKIMEKMTKIFGAMNLALFTLSTPALANTSWNVKGSFGDKVTDNGGSQIIEQLAAFVKPISGILIFVSVLVVGFEIIMKRNKADERMESMSSLMWVGIGAMVIGIAGMIASFLFKIQ